MRAVFFFFLLINWLTVFAAPTDSVWLRKNYVKKEVYIPMRDGVRLFTSIYEPVNSTEKSPVLICRTPYSVAPYGADTFRAYWQQHYMAYFKENYIMVMQDVRGRMMSEGEFEDVRPYNDHKKTNQDIDEASDTYDTIEWLLKNTKNNNGNVGIYGISYPGFYATMGALCQHPAMKAASPQAPVTDWFAGDDFHHNGAFMMMDAFGFYFSFGKARPYPTKTWPKGFDFPTKDMYEFYLRTGTMKELAAYMGDSIKFWNDMYRHPDYDAWWKARNTRNFVQHIPDGTATLVVGGLFDAEDCYGAWNLYKAIEKKAHNNNKLVIGPWAHGYWARDKGAYLGNVRFGSSTSEWYQQHIEIPYFNYYLKGKGNIKDIKEANIFFTGSNKWQQFDQWPPAGVQQTAFYLHPAGKLTMDANEAGETYTKYTSDPAKPVPYADGVFTNRTREYMTDDQRFAARRPDVLVFETDTLTEDLTIAGPVIADLFASISTTDADFVVKIIDVFPDNFSYNETDGPGNGKEYPTNGYQMMVRGEIMRGRYRNGLSKPESFNPGEVTEVKYKLPDIAHVFKKGHRLMVQIQSSWFPLADRNPQQLINIYEAKKNDFIKSTIKIFHTQEYDSKIILPVLK